MRRKTVLRLLQQTEQKAKETDSKKWKRALFAVKFIVKTKAAKDLPK